MHRIVVVDAAAVASDEWSTTPGRTERSDGSHPDATSRVGHVGVV